MGAAVEHRSGERVQVEIPVRLSVPPYAADVGTISNLSMSGVWIRTNLKPPVLARAHISFDSAQWFGHVAATVPAYVMRQDSHGVGLEWCELAPPKVNELLFAARGRVTFNTPSACKSRASEESAHSDGRHGCDAPLVLNARSLFGDYTPAAASISARPALLGPIL
jgi:hypothetical protein